MVRDDPDEFIRREDAMTYIWDNGLLDEEDIVKWVMTANAFEVEAIQDAVIKRIRELKRK